MAKKRFVFSSSKMSGLPGYNKKGFLRKKEELEEKTGWQVFDQFKQICPDGWSDGMAQVLSVVKNQCWAIYMWGAWYRSQGAWMELLTAHRFGLQIYIEQWWLRWIKWMLNLVFDFKRQNFDR